MHRFEIVTLAILILALWMAIRPYQGIFHDSRFYTAEALNRLLPGRFVQDLYFQFGSQGQFTIFSFIYAPLISLFGLSGGNIALTVAAQCLWLGGLGYLAKVLFRDARLAGAAVVGAILLPSGLSLPYGEPYVTPRSFAEALTFWALASQFKGHPVRALGILVVSLFVHPLMTLPGLVAWFLYAAARRRILWLLPIAGVAVLCALAFAGIQPFSRLLQRFDPTWLQVVRMRDDFCFVGLWKADLWIPLLGSFALGMFELVVATKKERAILWPVIAAAAAGILVSFIGGDVLHNVLLLDIQTWRFAWLSSLVVNLFAIMAFLRFRRAPWTGSFARGLLGTALVAMVVSRFFLPINMGAVFLLGLALLAAIWEWLKQRPLPPAARLAMALVAGFVLYVIIVGARITLARIGLVADPAAQAVVPFVLCVCISIATLCLLLRFEPGKALTPAINFGVACFFAVLAASQWDARTAWSKMVETSRPPSGLTDLLPDKAPIYWEGDITVPWFYLRHASFFSCGQGTGTLFSRDTAIAYGARYEEFAKLQSLDFRQYSYCPLRGTRRTAPLRRADLSALCEKEATLGALVLLERVAGAPYRPWTPPARFEALEPAPDGGRKAISADLFYIYNCAELR